MNRLNRPRHGPVTRRLARLALPLACLLPTTLSASVEMSAHVGGDAPAGDPLDANDVGGGGGGGGSHQDPHLPVIQVRVLPGPVVDGRRLLLIPVNQGGLLTFRLVIIDERAAIREAADAR